MEATCVTFELNRSSKKSQNLHSGNEMISANDSLNMHVKGELVKHLREMANNEARNYVGDLEEGTFLYSKNRPCHIIIHVCPPSTRRMDAPNWYPTVKPLMDGLTDMGMFEDDNDDVITSFTFVRGPKTNNKKYRIIIEIREGYFV